ncbi:hypothetical protein [Micromonospora radicis]|uniref:Uncharacterized protein n=1 Tax=Micromonospora radicis TaxID=1894971 RepID=A0A418MV11_9ACTN|nr:hypothetical protein [Micromonospora radicis]RIV38496.1 hypothetical protein D2L64_12480 [Micromonospora radicis]
MSKERAQRRAAREAEAARRRVARERALARRARRRALIRKMVPTRRGRTGRLRRYSRRERATIVALTLAVVALIWVLVPDLGLRIVLVVLLLLVLPVIVVIALDRRS